jgi:RNA polymerase sigma-70 factor (ECF subfamily)
VAAQQDHPAGREDNGANADGELVLAVSNGSVEAFEALYRRHVGRVHGLCLRLCGNQARAEELTQECFVRAWRKINSFRGDSAFGTWLYRLSTNLVLSDLRRHRHWEQSLDELPEEVDHHEPDAPLERDLERAIARLPDGARAVLVLHDIEGYSHPEISAMTGIAVGTSKTHLHRARRALRGWLA